LAAPYLVSFGESLMLYWLKKSKFQKKMMALGNISKKYVLLKQEGILATQKLLPKSWTKWYSSPEKLLRELIHS